MFDITIIISEPYWTYSHTEQKQKKTNLYVWHTYHIAGYQKRQGSHLYMEVKPCCRRSIFVQNSYVQLTGDHKSRRSHVCRWVWGCEGSNKVYSNTARLLASFPFSFYIEYMVQYIHTYSHPTKCILTQPGSATSLLSFLILYWFNICESELWF